MSSPAEVLDDLWKDLRNDCSLAKIKAVVTVIHAFHQTAFINTMEMELWERRITTCPGHEDEGGRVWCAYCGNMKVPTDTEDE
jgi:hypothetical protein